jgi:hypothetical protein
VTLCWKEKRRSPETFHSIVDFLPIPTSRQFAGGGLGHRVDWQAANFRFLVELIRFQGSQDSIALCCCRWVKMMHLVNFSAFSSCVARPSKKNHLIIDMKHRFERDFAQFTGCDDAS